MNFASPAMLFGLLLCAAPVLIHLLYRRTYRREPWAAMTFLRAAVRQQSRRVRLESLLLLATRVLLIALLVAGVAEPLTRQTALIAPDSIRRIIVLDVSASMRTTAAGRSAADMAVEQIERVIEGSGGADSWLLARIASSAPRVLVGRETFNPADLRTELRRWGATEEFGDVAGTLQQVADLISSSSRAASTEVLLVSDFQESNWAPLEGGAREAIQRLLRQIGRSARLRLIDVGPRVDGNAGVVDLEPDRLIAAPGQSLGFKAVVRNAGRTPTSATLEWRVGGEPRDVVKIELDGGAERTLEWWTRAAGNRALEVEARLAGEDPLLLDNHRYLAVPARQRLRVLLVDGRPGLRRRDSATGLLQLALHPPGPGGERSAQAAALDNDLQVITDVDLAGTTLEEFDAVWLCDASRISSDNWLSLAAYVEQGGGLVISPGDEIDVADYRAAADGAAMRLLPVKMLSIADVRNAQPPVTFETPNVDHPIVRPFLGRPEGGLATTLVDRFVTGELVGGEDMRVALRFSTGAPAIVERRVGSGRCLMLLTSADDRWGNWGVWPSFVPLVQQLVQYAAVGDAAARTLRVSEPIVRDLPPTASNVEVSMQRPQEQRVALSPRCDPERCRVRFDDTRSAGFYRLEVRRGVERDETFAVNPDIRESDPERLDPSELARGPLAGMSFDTGLPETVSEEGAATRNTSGSLATVLLLAAAAVLAIEQLLAWRFAVGLAAAGGLGCALLGAALSDIGFGWQVSAGVIVASVGALFWWLRRWRRTVAN